MNLGELKSLSTTFSLLCALSDYYHLLSVFLQELKDTAIQGTVDIGNNGLPFSAIYSSFLST